MKETVLKYHLNIFNDIELYGIEIKKLTMQVLRLICM